MGFYYVLSEKELIPIILNTNPNLNYATYIEQVNRKYGLSGQTTLDLAYSALANGIDVYFASPLNPLWAKAFEVTGEAPLFKVVSVNLNPDWTEDEIQTYG